MAVLTLACGGLFMRLETAEGREGGGERGVRGRRGGIETISLFPLSPAGQFLFGAIQILAAELKLKYLIQRPTLR